MTITIRREDFSTHFANRSFNVNAMSQGLRDSFAAHGIDDARLQRAANFDGEIRGEDFDRLFQELQVGDRITTRAGSPQNLDRASALFTNLDREARIIVPQQVQAQAQGGAPGLRGPMGNVRAPNAQAPNNGVGVGAPAVVNAPPPPPGPPSDMARLTALRTRADGTNVDTRVVPAARQAEIRATLRRAEDASARGDYATAAAAYRELGLPITVGGGQQNDPRALETAVVLGAANVRINRDGSWQAGYQVGSRGNQHLNDLNSFAGNAQMIDAMTRANIGAVSNPPTRAQAEAFMRHVAQSSGNDPTAIMQASAMMTNGIYNHYSSAGAQNPSYGPRVYTFNAHGQHFEFNTQREAQAAAQREHYRGRLLIVDTPGNWNNAMSHPERSGRRIGDCESKEYLQHQMTAAAGFTTLGSVNVEPRGQTAHMLGVMQAPGGRTFLTSNEQFYEVQGTGANGAVTNADIQRTALQAARDIYHVAPGAAFNPRMSYAREQPNPGVDPGVSAMRRSAGRVNEGILP